MAVMENKKKDVKFKLIIDDICVKIFLKSKKCVNFL